jgi:hypothetical protein
MERLDKRTSGRLSTSPAEANPYMCVYLAQLSWLVVVREKAAGNWERWSAWSPANHSRTTGHHSPPGPKAWPPRRDPNRIGSRQASVSLSGHGPSLVRGPRRNKGQPRIISDTDPAARRLSGQLGRGASCRLQRQTGTVVPSSGDQQEWPFVQVSSEHIVSSK